MVFDVSKITFLDTCPKKVEKNDEKERTLYYKNEKVFLVVNQNTIEVRCDGKLAQLLREKYESVMESRYFGRGGIEIVLAGQLTQSELEDLVRLSFDLTE